MTVDKTLEAVVRRDRLVVGLALSVVTVLSWLYLLVGAGMDMSAIEMTRMSKPVTAEGMSSMAVMTPAVWTPGYAVLMFFMWCTMMVAMMLPSVASMIQLFAAINRRQRENGHPHIATSMFAVGYLVAWTGFSLFAVVLQWGFERTGILSPMLVANNAVFGGVLLLVAGLYQFTSIKHACLRQCRSPLTFLSTHWRWNARGALRMGFFHGGFCVGCCWFLMGLLFFGGVMNLYWIAGLALFVLVEKLFSKGVWFGRVAGAGLVVTGTTLLAF